MPGSSDLPTDPKGCNVLYGDQDDHACLSQAAGATCMVSTRRKKATIVDFVRCCAEAQVARPWT